MTPTRFIRPTITRPFALACIAAVLIGLSALAAPHALARPADRVGLCHVTGSAANTSIFIQVNEHAVPTHLAHGDAIAANGETDCSPLPPNANPDAVDDAAATAEDTPVIVAVLDNDTDAEGHALVVTAIDTTSAAGGTVILNANGTVGYAPVADFSGDDTFTYTISDGHSGTGTATVHVTVAAVNDPPQAEPDYVGGEAFGDFSGIWVLDNDADADGDALTVTGIAAPPTWGEAIINGDGTVSYVPPADVCVANQDAFSYEIADGNGGTDTAEVTITIYDGGSPTLVSGSTTTAPGAPVTIAVVDFGSVGNTSWTLFSTVLDGPDHGSIAFASFGTAVTYTPDAGFTGSDQYTVEITNEYGCGGTATVTVAVG